MALITELTATRSKSIDAFLDLIHLLSDDTVELQSKIHISHLKKKKKKGDFNKKYF